MKLRAPANCVAITHQGRALEIAEDKSLEVEAADWMALSPHGFIHWDAGSLSQECRSAQEPARRRSAFVEAGSFANLLGRAPAPHPIAIEPRRAGLGNGEAISAISKLSRRELFAFLKERRISASIPITNEQLRALALRAIEFV